MQAIIIGAGGHGKVVLDILRSANTCEPVGFVDANASLAGQIIGGLPVLGPINLLPKLRQQKKIKAAIVAIGDNRARMKYADLLREQCFDLINAIHPSACVSTTTTLGQNIVIAPHACICTEAKIADSAIINTAAVVDHECEIGAGAHICPGVHLAGRVRIANRAMIGIGANVIQCIAIGSDAIIGAGAAVIRDVPDGATAVGVPARVIKVTERDLVLSEA